MTNDIINIENALSTDRLFDQIKTIEQEDTWLKNNVSPNTKKAYLYAVKEFCLFLGIKSRDELRSVNSGHIIAYRDFLKTNDKSDRTISTRLSALSSLFDDLASNQIIESNPAQYVKRPKMDHGKVVTERLSEGQMLEMMDGPDKSTLKGLRDWVFLSILFGTGCRISEVCNLSVKDNYGVDTYFVLKFIVKGGKEHTVAISPTLQSRINQYLELSGHGETPDSPLLLSYSNRTIGSQKHITTGSGTHIWNRYRVETKSTPHASRSTFASEAIRRGETLINVQDTLAHADPRTTLKYNKNEKDLKNSVALGARI
jgi:integrase/recombinase XerD